MVGYPDDLETVVLGEGGALAGMKPGSLLIDFTTSCPELAKKIAEAASEKGVLSLDAPVSGGDIGAKGGTLAIMCGGSDEAFPKQNLCSKSWAIKSNILVELARGKG